MLVSWMSPELIPGGLVWDVAVPLNFITLNFKFLVSDRKVNTFHLKNTSQCTRTLIKSPYWGEWEAWMIYLETRSKHWKLQITFVVVAILSDILQLYFIWVFTLSHPIQNNYVEKKSKARIQYTRKWDPKYSPSC